MLDLEKVMHHAAAKGRFDANETVGFARQFEHLMTEVQKAESVTLRARELFPVTTEVSDTDESYTYRQQAAVGKAKMGHLRANDIPSVSLYAKEFPAPVRDIMVGYDYTIDEVRRALRGGTNITADKALAARVAINEVEEEVAFRGAPEFLVPGLFSAGSGISQVTRLSAQSWDNAATTPIDIIRDVDALFGQTWRATAKMDRVADTLVVGTLGYQILNQVYPNPGFRDDTVASFLLRTNVFLKAIEHAAWVDDLGAGNKERIFAYRRDPTCIAMVIPLDFEQSAPDLEGFVFSVACRSKTGGIMLKQPKTAAYMDTCINAAPIGGSVSIG